MIKFKRIITAVLAALVVTTSVPIFPSIEVEAASFSSTDKDREDFVTNLLNKDYGAYLLQVQPYGCLDMPENGGTVMVTEGMLSVNYKDGHNGNYGGVIDLPRLSADYYYSIVGNASGFAVNRTLYPSLSWTQEMKAGSTTTVTISINRESDGGSVYSCSLTFSGDFHGIEYNNNVFRDVSDNILGKLLQDNTSVMRPIKIAGNGIAMCYPAELHEDAIITSYYAIGHGSVFEQACNSNIFGVVPSIEDWQPEYTVYSNTIQGKSGQINLKKHLAEKYKNKPAGRADFFCVFSPTATYQRGQGFNTSGGGVVYDSNRGIVQTPITVKQLYDQYTANIAGVYAYCFEDKIEIYQVNSATYNGDLKDVAANAPVLDMTNGEVYKINNSFKRDDIYHWLIDNGHLFTVNGKDAADQSNRDELLSVKEIVYKSEDANRLSVYASAMAYNGVSPQVMTIGAKAPETYFTLVTRHQPPNDSSAPSVLDSEYEVPINNDLSGIRIKEPSEYYEYYTFAGWFTDEACTQAATLKETQAKANEGDTITWYGKYDYTGGEYGVTFYNDATKTSSTQKVETRNQPKVPEVENQPGYLFKNWQIVDTVASTSGTPYDPDEFKPKKNRKYTFKTFWDVQGIITEVSTLKNTYYVGEDIDKSKIIVTLQTDNNGNTRTLNTDEFDVSPAKIATTGTNQITVTYKETGATATFSISGRDAVPTSLTARYSGGALDVGKSIEKSNINVTLNYSNGKTEPLTTSQFTISPSTVAAAGNNTIRVTYGTLSTTVTVVGNKVTNTNNGNSNSGSSSTNKPSSSSGSNSNTNQNKPTTTKPTTKPNTSTRKEITSIRATYKGGDVHVGDILRASDIEVIAQYSDNSTTQIASSAFQFSPSYVRSVGDNAITVTYSGKSTNLTVNATQSAEEDNGDEETESSESSSSSTSHGGSSNTGAANSNQEIIRSINEKTGAGRPATKTETSKSYIGGYNILSDNLYSSAKPDTNLVNEVDIMEQLDMLEPAATKTTITLYNGASGNDIPIEAMEKVKELGIQMDIEMIDAERNEAVGLWTIDGSNLVNTDSAFNPNITFDVVEKGPELLTYMGVDAGSYPDNIQLTVYPNVRTYESGETVYLYTCDSNKENAHQDSSFNWSDLSNPVRFDISNHKDYCITNTTVSYAPGSSLMGDPTGDVQQGAVGEVVGDNEEFSEEETGEIDESFDWGDDPVETQSKPEDSKKAKFPIAIIVVGGLAVLFGAGVITAVILLLKGRKSRSTNGEDELPMPEIEDEDEDLDVDTDTEGYSESDIEEQNFDEEEES